MRDQFENCHQRHLEDPPGALYYTRHTKTPLMFNSQELELLSYGLTALKDFQEADLLITSDEKFLSRVRTEIKETDALMAKVKDLTGQNQNWHTGS